ncbi:DEAD/DEAH box helicase [Haloferula sargassicola]|uniref:Helicase/UvrB N-terminal domain-containing protein n=1 Tax=Haloferula sargassicola TaxID=490096 RepID=A0ABP9UVV6_9BACT
MIAPKPFQQPYIANILDLFRAAKGYYDEAIGPADQRRAFSYNGAVLLKAPTGAGKTIMAGTVAEKFATEEKVVWFWFAPFKGLVGQAGMSLRDHHPGLRVRDLASDRQTNGTRSGDTFILTWASVVSRAADARKVRQDGERFPSFDEMLEELRADGFRIGVVIDEAHHGISSTSQSMELYRDLLAPDYSLMITATPDDSDAEKFTKAAGIMELHRVTVARIEAVECNGPGVAGLIKPGVKSIAYISPPDQAALADFEAAALQDACTTHARIKQELASMGVNLVPLMLVQVGSGAGAVDEAKVALKGLGFAEESIAVHTAKEPDENFLSIAHNEEVEVLIFKMAAALGFDAPRAFVMASMRAIKDTDFGTQLVGRIMRVHRRLQGRELPPLLREGYLFLADSDSQAGITAAAEKINKLKSQLTQTSPFTMITRVAGGTQVQVVTNNQPDLRLDEPDEEAVGQLPKPAGAERIPAGKAVETSQEMLDLLDQVTEAAREEDRARREEHPAEGIHRYERKKEAPMRFRTQELPLEIDDLLECIQQQVKFDDAKLLQGLASDVQIIRVERGHFRGVVAEEERSIIKARIDIEKAERQAQAMLLRQQYLSAKELLDHLLKRLAKEFVNHGFGEVADDEDRLEAALALILVRHPNLLSDVEKECAARFSTTREAEPLPGFIESATALNASHRNIYGVFPGDLNPWEVEFAKLLDNDPTGTVLWWHRNPPRKKYSVAIVRPDGGRFFPDFVVGVRGRSLSKDGILLVETKHAIGSVDSQIKAVVEHKDYGAALMIHWKDWIEPKKRMAMTVRYNPRKDKNELDAVFRCESMPTY